MGSAHSAALIWRALALAVLLAGCATQVPLGEPLAQAGVATGYRFSATQPERRTDDLLLIVAFSGGGHRAAALAYGALEQLAADRIEHDGGNKRLLDEVDVISAVSGGSIVGAYYALHGDAVFTRFRPEFLDRNVQSELVRSMFSPANWLRLASARYARGDLFAEYLDRRLFQGATFADLAQLPERPYLVINATDLGGAGRFEFTQGWFDAICVDLARYPVARAVAASSAFPVLLTPIAVGNRSGTCGFQPPVQLAQDREPVLAQRAVRLSARLRAYQDPAVLPYLHLADGALSDNLGIRSVIDVLVGARDFEEARRQLGLTGVRRIAVIAVDAAGYAGQRLAAKRDAPSVVDMAALAGGVMVEDVADGNRTVLQQLLERIAAEGVGAIQTYWIDVELAALGDAARRERLRTIPTNLHVPRAQVDELICSAHELLAQSVQYRQLLTDLSGSAPVPGACR